MPKKIGAKSKKPSLQHLIGEDNVRPSSTMSLHKKPRQKMLSPPPQNVYRLKQSLHELPRNKTKVTPLNTHKSRQHTTKRSQSQHKITLRQGLNSKSHQSSAKPKLLKLPINQSQPNELSFREYCIVDQDFVPLETSDEKRYIYELMSGKLTMSTHCPEPQVIKKELGNSIHAQTDNAQNCDQGIYVHFEEQKPLYEEAGTQYTHRENNTDRGSKGSNSDRKKDPPSAPREQESLDDILLKLEFLHLPNNKCFDKLSHTQRSHYKELLESVIQKLAVSPRTNVGNKKVNIRSTSFEEGMVPIAQIEAFEKSPRSDIERMYESLEYEVRLRQCRQLNFIRDEIPHYIDYTLISIVNEINNLLTFLQLNYSAEMILILNRVYGLSYKDRFLRISRKLNVENLNYKKILPQDMIREFCKEHVSDGETPQKQNQQSYSSCKSTFLRAIFDSISEQMDGYRAFFTSDGQPFPWSLKIIKSITFFTIDQEAIEIIFSQIKQKLITYVSSLCGILVDPEQDEQLGSLLNPVIRKRRETEDKLVQNWLKTIDQVPQFQNMATTVLIQLSESIISSLFEEASQEISNFK